MGVLKKYTALSRFFELIRHIHVNEGLTVKDLADHFSTSENQIYHDLQVLNAAGVPIFFSSTGYRILPAFFGNFQTFTADETLILMLGLSLLEENGAINPDQFRSLQAKILASDSEIAAERLTRIGESFRTPSPVKNVFNPRIMAVLNQAILERRRVRMLYRSRDGQEPARRDLSPYTIIHRKDAWYVIGHCHKRDEVRTFKVSRIEELETTPEPFRQDDEFDIDTYLMYSWNIMGGETHIVIVRFDREIGPLILEKQIAHGRAWKERGFVYLQTVVSGLEEFSWWIMQYGEHAEVLQPRELRRMLAKRCAKMSANYNEPVHHRSRRVKSCRNIYL